MELDQNENNSVIRSLLNCPQKDGSQYLLFLMSNCETTQLLALQLVKENNLKKLLNKTIQAALNDEGIGAYSSRKGLTDLMLANGQRLEDISVWLGHVQYL